MNRARLNLVLLAVAAGLGVAVFFAQKEGPAGPPLTPLKPDAVARIALEHPGAPAIRLEKRDSQWHLTEPVQAEADIFEVNGILGLADRETRLKLEGGALKDFGLEPPNYTVTLNDRAVGFGGVEPLEFRRYVKTADGAFLVEDPPGAALDADYADLVAKDLLPSGSEPERIEVPGLVLARDAEGKWAATPAGPKATADAMQKLADGWKGARSMWNELARDARISGDKVKVTLKGGATREFTIAARDPQFRLHRADLGVTFVLSKALADELLTLPEPPAPDAGTP
jgi:hypothetical protein